MQTKIELLLELIANYKRTNSEETLETIADLVEDNYETLEPIMLSHGVTY